MKLHADMHTYIRIYICIFNKMGQNKILFLPIIKTIKLIRRLIERGSVAKYVFFRGHLKMFLKIKKKSKFGIRFNIFFHFDKTSYFSTFTQ